MPRPRLHDPTRVAALAMLVCICGGLAQAQGPQVEVQGPPGASFGRGKLGAQPGDSGIDAADTAPRLGTFGGKPGLSVGRAGTAEMIQQMRFRPQGLTDAQMQFKRLQPAEVPKFGALDIPPGPEDLGPPDGLTLDAAIERLLRANLDLLALRYEIPMAEADVLTASLRNNPILYADSQLVPYGHFSNTRPGGVTQYDVNVTLQLDVWRKRRARTEVAKRAMCVTQAQFQDAVRNQIDNLYTAYVDVVAADETVRYSRAYTKGAKEILKLNLDRVRVGAITPSVTDALRAQVEQAELQEDEAERALAKTTRTLALLLDVPSSEADGLKVRAALGNFDPLPTASDELVRVALNSRPDLAAHRLGTLRAEADAKLARANRYSDVYVLAQPYTYQDNRYLGFRGSYSFAVGATIGLPVYNRNQGNIRRAELNQRQTQVELAALERQVIYDVEDAVREFELTLNSVRQMRDEVVPASRRVLDSAEQRFRNGLTSVGDFLEARKDYNEVVQKYRDALVRHRRSMLDLNTAVGARVLQ